MKASSGDRTLVLVLLCTAQFMLILDIAIVNVALPSIGRDLDFSPEDLQWVVTANLVAFGGLLLLGGRAADLLGRRRVLVAGLCSSPPGRWAAPSPRPAAPSLALASCRELVQRSEFQRLWR